MVKSGLPGRQIDVVADRDELLRDAGAPIPMVQDHQVVRVRIRQRPQQHRFDDGKNRDVRADTQGEREDRRGAERRFAHDHPERVAEIVEQHGVIRRTLIGFSCDRSHVTAWCRFVAL